MIGKDLECLYQIELNSASPIRSTLKSIALQTMLKALMAIGTKGSGLALKVSALLLPDDPMARAIKK